MQGIGMELRRVNLIKRGVCGCFRKLLNFIFFKTSDKTLIFRRKAWYLKPTCTNFDSKFQNGKILMETTFMKETCVLKENV